MRVLTCRPAEVTTRLRKTNCNLNRYTSVLAVLEA